MLRPPPRPGILAGFVRLGGDGRGRVGHASEPNAASLWRQVSGQLEAELGGLYSTCFGEVVALELTDQVFTLGAPDAFARDWIRERFLDLIQTAASGAAGKSLSIQLQVVERAPGGESRREARPRRVSHLNAKYTFDTYVIGASNRFAHAAALAVAEAPTQGFNPLVVHGGTGLGKTHLLKAVAHHVAEHTDDLTVRYVTSETFLNEFVYALGDRRRIAGFKERYRNCGVLLLDDVHFFARKDRIQEEFLHTFSALHEAGSRIVIASDRPPREIAKLDTGLRSRFEMGLVAEIQPPDLRTRIAILRKLVRSQDIRVRDPQVLPLIAARVSNNVRELEGALTRVVGFSSLMGCPITVELAQKLLADEASDVSIERVEEVVSDRFDLSVADLRGPRRTAKIVYPRQVAMHLARELTDASLPRIGRHFGRDHTTVLYADRKLRERVEQDPEARDLVQDLIGRIQRR